ncbi:hypothetical protein G5714_018014 [Onychostoma macrolepis]|uniref:Uncharacterized protein n=1 Tax=Onychostoma macrolepis TaxID=369639 RepID=A0A7J6C6X5_9TELE|nr:hypothetical protein G5714_018014 [Onychostoma macrolepis]
MQKWGSLQLRAQQDRAEEFQLDRIVLNPCRFYGRTFCQDIHSDDKVRHCPRNSMIGKDVQMSGTGKSHKGMLKQTGTTQEQPSETHREQMQKWGSLQLRAQQDRAEEFQLDRIVLNPCRFYGRTFCQDIHSDDKVRHCPRNSMIGKDVQMSGTGKSHKGMLKQSGTYGNNTGTTV